MKDTLTRTRAPMITPLEKRLMLDASLPVITGQVLWLDAADKTTILDAEGDNANAGAAFSGSVRTWVDKSGSGFNVTQATAANRPTYNATGLNGNGVITFDGTNDKLTNSTAQVLGNDYTMFIVFDRSIATGRDAVFELGGGSSRNALFVNENANKLGFYANSAFYNSTSVYTPGTYEVVTMMHDVNAISMWRNGVNDLNTTGLTRANTTGIYVGDDSSGGDELNGHIAEIIVYDRDLTADERRDIENYLAAKWGRTIAINAAPTLVNNTGATVSQSDPVTITSAMLSSTDADNTDSRLIYTLTDLADHGTLTNTNTSHTYILGETFTQSDIDNGYIRYTHGGTANFSDSFSFTVTDQYAVTSASTFSLTITPDNVAPQFQGWTLVSYEDFQSGATGWSDNTTETSNPYLTRFLGRHSMEGGAQNTYKTYTLSGTETSTVIEFDMYKLDSWDGEFFRVFINDTQVINLSMNQGVFHTFPDGSSGIVSYTVQEMTPFAANFTLGTWNDQIMRFTLTINNPNAASIKLGFSSTLDQAVADEAWGVDNIKVYEVGAPGTPGPFSVVENNPIGTVVGRVNATDANVGDTITYSIVGGTGASVFAINASTGVITTTAAINYEAISSYTLDIRATDNGTGSLFDAKTITISVTDMPENTAPTTNVLGPITIAENTANGTVIGTMTGNDAEGNTITWSITGGNTDSIFAINASTGAIRVNSNTNLNYEWDNSYTLTIQAQDNGFGNLTSTRNVTINITNVNEAPTFNIPQSFLNQNPYLRYNATTGNFYMYVGTTANYATASAAAAANMLNGVAGHLATITSAAENTYVRSLGSGNLWLGATDATVEGEWRWVSGGAESGQMFWLGAAAGAAQGGYYTNWVAGNPDNSSNEDHLEMQASGLWNDSVSSTAKAYVIEWEGSAVLAALGNGPFSLAENPALNQSVGFVHARDADAGDTLSYSITGGTGAAHFAVNSATGEITVTNPSAINYESATSYTLNMRVQDVAGLFSTQTVTINITDVNEAPVLSPAGPFNVVENTAIGTLVATMSATDDDGAAQTLTYSIVSGNTDNIFAINASTGAITIANNPNYELGSSYNLTIRVTDNGTGALFDSEVVTINITDVNEAPVLSPAGPFTIAENTAAGTLITTMSATDDDGHTITYSITAGNGAGIFAINASTGAITLASSPDYEAGSVYNLTITATDNGTGALTDTEVVTVNITNVNEAPVLNPGGPFTVTENSANNTLVGTLTATDPDGTALTWVITAGNERGIFSVNNSGQIRIANNTYLDYELATTHTIQIRVSDGTLTSQRNITINVGNVQEAPSFDAVQRVLNADPTLRYSAATGNFYRFVASNANYAGAIAAATSAMINGQAGYLLHVDSLAESNYIRTIISNTIWIDGTDAAVEGEWRYSTGPNAGDLFWLGAAGGSAQNGYYTAWSSGEPNNSGGNEDGIEFRTNGTWNDTNVSGSRYYVIEWDGASIIASMQNTPQSIDENSALNSIVGTIRANDPEGGAITYSITGGTGASVFSLDAAAGQIRLIAPIDHETVDSYTLNVRAQDPTGLFTIMTVTININDLNEAPVITPAGPFSVSEAVANGTLVGTVSASDVDDGQSLSYAIIGGNTNGIFSINNAGEIRVFNNTYLDYELLANYNLQIRVTDNGTGNLTDTEIVTVNLTNVNEAPSFDPVQRILNSDPTLRYNPATGNFYRFVSATANAATAESNASTAMLNGQAGYLTHIDSAAENSFVRSISRDVIWIGGSDSANEGQWIYTSGPNAGDMFWLGTASGSAQNGYYSNWGAGEPNNSGNEDAIEMRADGMWNDMNATQLRGYVIEWNGADVLASLQHGPYDVPEHSVVTFSPGTALANDPDAGDTITYSITGGTGAGLFSISPTGVIRLTGSVNYEVQNSYTLDLRVQDGGGLFDTMTITVNIIDQNDTPSVLNLSGNHIVENSGPGILIGTLSTADEDPADTHIYTLVTNPAGKFIIVGNQLRTAADIDYEQYQSFTVIMRVDDGNGGILNRAFMINVGDVMDTFTPPPTTGSGGNPDPFVPPEEEEAGGPVNLLGASLQGDMAQGRSFYSRDGWQILRENITFRIRDILSLFSGRNEKLDEFSAFEGLGSSVQPMNFDLSTGAHYTNLREALEFLQQIENARESGEEILEEGEEARTEALPDNTIDRQFVDVMTYHQERAAKLRQALMGA